MDRWSAVEKITSSRQSPKRSALNTGVDFVPLIETHPSAVNSRPAPYLSMWFPSSNSRVRSPSHQIRKLVDGGLAPIRSPAVFSNPWDPENHSSAPGFDASILAA